MKRLALATLLATLFLGACTVRGRPEVNEPLIQEEQHVSRADAPKPVEAPAPAPQTVPVRRIGSITRAELTQVLDGAPGRFLQHVESEPRFRSGKFHGWRLVAFFPGDTRFAGVDLRAGDVVTRVNGAIIERPEHLMKVWEALRSSRELVVEVEREGVAHTLRYTIHD